MANPRDLAYSQRHASRTAHRADDGRLRQLLHSLVRRGWPLALLTMSFVLATIAVWRTWIVPIASVESLRQQIEQANDADVATPLQRLAESGDEGIEGLVEYLISHRHVVRLGAGGILNQQFVAWQQLQSTERDRCLNHLATTLATHVAHMPGDAQRTAEQVAERILTQPMLDDSGSHTRRWQACHRVLAAAREGRDARPAAIANFRKLPEHSPAVATSSHRSVGGSRELAGGDLPVQPADMPTSKSVKTVEPRLLITEIGTDSGKPTGTPIVDVPKRHVSQHALHTAANEPSALNDSARHSNSSIARLGLNRDGPAASHDVSSSSSIRSSGRPPFIVAQPEINARPESLVRLLELAERMKSPDHKTPAAADKQLQGEDLTEVHLNLARGLVDRDPATRQEAIAALPYVVGLPAGEWLIWLSYDDDAAVRRAALALLATSSDPAAKKRLLEAATFDTDDAVRALAAQAEGNARERR